MILYDLVALQPQGDVLKHGGGSYAKSIFYRLLERNISFAVFYNSCLDLDADIKNELKQYAIQAYDLNQLSLADIVAMNPNAVIYSILPQQYMFDVCLTIGTIHDCRELELPNDFFEFLYPISFRRIFVKIYRYIFPVNYNNRIKRIVSRKWLHKNFIPTTITNYTKELLIKSFETDKFNSIPIFMTPFFGDNYSLTSNNITICKKKKYFLMVSGDRWLKNNLRALIALDQLFSTDLLREYKVIITGVKTLNIFKYRFKNVHHFETLGYVSDEKLEQLYRDAYCFVFPSLNEGFGIPPLESMRFGTPVLASCSSAIPEVCGNSVLLFNPYSISDIRNRIKELVVDSNLYKDMQLNGQKHYLKMKSKALSDIDNYINYVLEYEAAIKKENIR